jgi:hypothetical protein
MTVLRANSVHRDEVDWTSLEDSERSFGDSTAGFASANRSLPSNGGLQLSRNLVQRCRDR